MLILMRLSALILPCWLQTDQLGYWFSLHYRVAPPITYVFGYYVNVICVGACYDGFASPNTSEEGLWQVRRSHYLVSNSGVCTLKTLEWIRAFPEYFISVLCSGNQDW